MELKEIRDEESKVIAKLLEVSKNVNLDKDEHFDAIVDCIRLLSSLQWEIHDDSLIKCPIDER